MYISGLVECISIYVARRLPSSVSLLLLESQSRERKNLLQLKMVIENRIRAGLNSAIPGPGYSTAIAESLVSAFANIC